MHYDYLIVGAGPAGCVLANRLSDDPRVTVCLVEAGPDYGAKLADWPAPLLDASSIPESGDGWGYSANNNLTGEPVGLPRSRNIGGTTAMNGCLWLRGSAADYDGWEERGNPGWGFTDLLPYFRKAENDPLGGRFHGDDGPVPVHRLLPDQQTGYERLVVAASEAIGIPELLDFNAGPVQQTGIGPGPSNTRDGIRLNAALTYLNPVRERSNLTIMPGTLVEKLTLDGSRISGAVAAGGTRFEADQTLLCGGAYGSPAVLLRSGIGPQEHLQQMEIRVVADLAGVGANLFDHPKVDGCLEALIDERYQPTATGFQDVLIAARSEQTDDEIDLYIFQGQSFDEASGLWIHWATTSLQHSRSTGSVRLTGAEAGAPLLIDHAWLKEAVDLETLCDGVELIGRLFQAPPLAGVVTPIPDKSLSWQDRTELRQKVQRQVGTTFHPCGTCKMGPDSDAMAVVDASCRVRGVDGLRVIDASVFPVIPRCTIHFPIVAVAEQMAEELLRG